MDYNQAPSGFYVKPNGESDSEDRVLIWAKVSLDIMTGFGFLDLMLALAFEIERIGKIKR